jgi:hypothetical protein
MDEKEWKKEQKKRKRGVERCIRRNKRRAYIAEHKVSILVWSVISVVGFGVLCLLVRFAYFSYTNLREKVRLNDTVNQISQLVENVRTALLVQPDTDLSDISSLVKKGIVPLNMVRQNRNHPINRYGGDVLIARSLPIMSASGTEIPSFKIAYLGLSQEACINLAVMNWGTKEQGLVAVALGYLQPNGKDKAFTYIDMENNKDKMVEKIGADGQKKVIIVPKQNITNVAKPGDRAMPTPFSEERAEIECSCERGNNCSFAVRYAVYGAKM